MGVAFNKSLDIVDKNKVAIDAQIERVFDKKNELEGKRKKKKKEDKE